MNSETANLIELVTNKGPSYSSAYELFPQFLFRKRKVPTVDPEQVPQKVYTQRFDIEDFPELGPTTYEHHPMMYPRFYYNTTVYVSEKEPVEQPAPVVAQPEVAEQIVDPVAQPQTDTSISIAGDSLPDHQTATLPEPHLLPSDSTPELAAKIRELEESLHSWRSKAEQYLKERDPQIVQRELEEQLAIEQRDREEVEARVREAEARVREAERVERERVEAIRREEEEKRIKKEQEKERVRREREEYYKTYDFSGYHFRYYNLSKMDEVNLFQLYKFASSDPELRTWKSGIKEELLGRFDWRLKVCFPKIRPQIQLLCNKKYAEMGSIHRLIGQLAKQKRHFINHGQFQEHQSQAARLKGIEAYFNF